MFSFTGLVCIDNAVLSASCEIRRSLNVVLIIALISCLPGLFNVETEPGDRVAVDEPIAQIETDKVSLST